jgi:hypothetical protein
MSSDYRKLEDGEIRDAVRLVANDDTMTLFDAVTAAVLRTKCPVRADTRIADAERTPVDSCLVSLHNPTTWWTSSPS